MRVFAFRTRCDAASLAAATVVSLLVVGNASGLMRGPGWDSTSPVPRIRVRPVVGPEVGDIALLFAFVRDETSGLAVTVSFNTILVGMVRENLILPKYFPFSLELGLVPSRSTLRDSRLVSSRHPRDRDFSRDFPQKVLGLEGLEVAFGWYKIYRGMAALQTFRFLKQ